ncbi:hypothetical protein [Salininema proteolyticum]|uniref:YD repeat-containing protein n=1 Tax=Salininema proteolyticum TaxID=1607685 RepID=A0ABV8U2A7_9ACTN
MAWTWTFENADGDTLPVDQPSHDNQGDAETWLGEVWREQTDAGAQTAVLYDDEREVYRMSLEPSEN